MKEIVLGLLTPLIVYAVVTLLHIALPTKKIKGYVKDEKTGEVLNYRINGKYVLILSILIWFGLGYFNIVPYEWLYVVRWYSLIGAVVLGLFYSFWMVLKHQPVKDSFLKDMWFGRVKNPQLKQGFLDAKVWLYLIGAVMLQLNVLSFAAFHIKNVADTNFGFLMGCGMLTWFCFDYLIFEKVHLWTYDFIAERVGFKLGFGCLAFYPYFYSVSLWFVADRPSTNVPTLVTILFGVLFLCGWTFTRGANMQKYRFKTAPDKKFLWIMPEVLTNGTHSLLVNGYWGKSRHINYLGEIIQAIAIALSTGYFGVAMVWLYPLYYIGLMLPRQLDDDKICKEKYGDLWDEYKEKVKYRIIPFIY